MAIPQIDLLQLVVLTIENVFTNKKGSSREPGFEQLVKNNIIKGYRLDQENRDTQQRT